MEKESILLLSMGHQRVGNHRLQGKYTRSFKNSAEMRRIRRVRSWFRLIALRSF